MLAAKKQATACQDRIYTVTKPNLYTIAGRKTKRKVRYQVKTVAAVLVIFAFSLLYTATESRITTYGYEINQLKQSITETENTNSRCLLEIEELSSPERISTYATESLGMVKPEDGYIQYVDSSAIVAAKNISVMDSDVPSSQTASVEVVEGETMHPILATLNKMFNDYIVVWRDGASQHAASNSINPNDATNTNNNSNVK